MALDAHVCCDCFERGRLRCPPPPGCNPSVCDDGGLLSGSNDFDVQLAFDRWLQSEACEHEDCWLVAHHIGNIARVAALRAELGQWPERFPVILSRVIYNGVHGGDYISAAELPHFLPELESLKEVRFPDTKREQRIRGFEGQLRELVEAALQVSKPLVF